MQYTEIFKNKKMKISSENFDLFNIFAQNIYREYTLEPPRRITNLDLPLQTTVVFFFFFFFYIKVVLKGIFISRTCFPDGNSLTHLFGLIVLVRRRVISRVPESMTRLKRSNKIMSSTCYIKM